VLTAPVSYFFAFFDFVVKNLAAGHAPGMALFPRQKIATEGDFLPAQGIVAVSFVAAGKKDTSGKPGPRAVLPYGQVGARMRPNGLYQSV
jgi:hypothetical protein